MTKNSSSAHPPATPLPTSGRTSQGRAKWTITAAWVYPKTAQERARHSNINLTMSKDTHVRLSDLSTAVDSLPGLHRGGASQQATGTDDFTGPKLAQTGDFRCNSLRPIETTNGLGGKENDRMNLAVDGKNHAVNIQRGRRDLNPQPPDRQSGTLTN